MCLGFPEVSIQGLLFCLLKGGFKVSSGTVEWYKCSHCTDFDNSEIASPASGGGAKAAPRRLFR